MITVKVTCPYCGNIQYRNVKERCVVLLVSCESEEGGCDEYFVSRIVLSYDVTNYTLKENNEQ